MITLVIIGIVAALTIPNLMQKYTEQTTVKKVQKFYSNLSNAYNLAMKDNGPAMEWKANYDSAGATKIYNLLFKPYFKIAKNCGTNNTGNCIINDKYKLLNNTDMTLIYGTGTGYYKISLEDGAAVFFRANDDATVYNVAVFYDINGINKPNQWGKDLFYFVIKNNKVFPIGLQAEEYNINPFYTTCNKANASATGHGCAAWVVYKGNMDYLHCDGLTWESRSCKDK